MIDFEKEKREVSTEDYIFGATSTPCITNIAIPARGFYLPIGERQNIGSEKSDCATRSPINLLETKFNWLLRMKKLKNVQWLEQNGYIKDNYIEFSDRYVAVLSGTTLQGNSLIAPLKAIHEWGLIPKAMFPQVPNAKDYYTQPTDEMKALGKKFAEIFTINYERVYTKDLPTALENDMVGVAAYAWPMPVNGVYPRADDMPFNHAFLVWKPLYSAFDNYIDQVDGDFIKALASDYNFYEYGYRVYISAENVNQPELQISIIKEIISKMRETISLLEKLIIKLGKICGLK